ncbi:TfoX/Sxy family protein [Pelagibius sp. Alg239-R121]|uniref:TfoX/Sxy family protein n=1 Tax=Pelagibius sp. Alg239-R121 TaxID=2993448 RepID=UPI0024A6C47D|nr:TfoX/Sxy family protein [Pelagibius sp. Alg239-R121]
MAKPRPAIVDHSLDLLLPLGPVKARAMFGGYGLYLEDLMFALIAFDTLYFKADSQSEEQFSAAGGEPFTYEGKSKPIQMSYWTVPDEAMEDPESLLPWAERAVSAARRSKPVKKRKRSKDR